MENTTPQYLNEKEVSKVTGIALSSLRNQRFERRGIPYYKVGRSVRYKVEDVIQHVERIRIQPEEANNA
ncbi:helix-turn-helix transcriptional regulator [Candidatus Latescibacterota bacterium]